MESSKADRLRELVQKLADKDGHLRALPIDETRELQRLLRQEMAEVEFGCPVYGED
ncbi:hypothetical protein ES705_28836 [subsurface metagenome]